MLWLWLSLLSALFYGASTVLDKYVVSRLEKDFAVIIFLCSAVYLTAAVVPLAFFPLQVPGATALLAVLAGGAVWTLGSFAYFKALYGEEVTRVSLLTTSFGTPLFTAIIAAFLLGEVFPASKYLGAFLVVSGAVLVSLRKTESLALRLSPAAIPVLGVGLAMALNAVSVKFALGYADPVSVYFWNRLGAFAAALAVIPSALPALESALSRKKTVAFISLATLAGVFARYLQVFAFDAGPATFVQAVVSTESFFVLVIALLASVFKPGRVEEEFRGSTMILKALAVLLVLFGMHLLV